MNPLAANVVKKETLKLLSARWFPDEVKSSYISVAMIYPYIRAYIVIDAFNAFSRKYGKCHIGAFVLRWLFCFVFVICVPLFYFGEGTVR